MMRDETVKRVNDQKKRLKARDCFEPFLCRSIKKRGSVIPIRNDYMNLSEKNLLALFVLI